MDNKSHLTSLRKLTQSTEQQYESSTGEFVTNVNSSESLPRRPADKNSKCLPLKNPSQNFVAINIGHQNQQCKTPTGAARVLGFFDTAEAIVENFPTPDLNVYTIPVGAWFSITKTPTPKDQEGALQEKVVKRVEAYIHEKRDEAKTIVEQSTSSNEKERYEQSVDSMKRMQGVDTFMESIGEAKHVPVVSRNDEIRGQNYCVLSIITSSDPNDEPLLQFFQAFDSREDARDYLRNTLHSAKIPTNAFVCSMYEWIVPLYTKSYKFKENVDQSFTHTELEELYQGQKFEEAKIKELMSTKEAQERMKHIEEEMEREKTDVQGNDEDGTNVAEV